MNAGVDPWLITPRERAKYHDQFRSLNPVNGIVTGGQAKGFFLQSTLPPLVLAQIWALADTDSDGKMNINEFSIACKLISMKLRGYEAPKVLPPTLLASLNSVGGTPSMTPTGSLSPIAGAPAVGAIPVLPTQPAMIAAHQPQLINTMPGIMPQIQPTVPIVPVQPTMPLAPVHPAMSMTQQMQMMGGAPAMGMIPQPMQAQAMPTAHPMVPGAVPIAAVQPTQIEAASTILPRKPSGGTIIPPTTSNGSLIDVLESNLTLDLMSDQKKSTPAPPTPPSGTQSRTMSISEKAPSIESPGSMNGTVDWAIKGPAKLKYTQLFNTTDRTRSGFLTGVQARGLMLQSKLPQAVLAQIWALSDMDSDGRLGCEEFVLAMYLCDMAIQGETIPAKLPPDLVPPSFRKIQSRHGSLAGSRHGSISSIGAVMSGDADPSAGLPQTSFEDKRKENFDKGQAELERRRKALLDIQRKEQEERERKEREENEKREKARLEAERKQQEELDRQLQRQREIEQEKEERRKRELEQKEAARKEMERQRQIEWENQRIADMQQQRQREQEKVLKLKAQNQTMTIELGSLNDRIKELSQKICDTRSGVTNVKTVIDGMRTTRDTQMQEMAQLKARIKEQNQKLVQLSQEKAKMEAKSKQMQGGDGSNEEHLSAAFSQKQIIIKQLKDKVENAKEEMNGKTSDIESNREQLEELKTELGTLIATCEDIYSQYDEKRNQILEMKHNQKNNTITSSWDTGSSWPVDNSTVATSAPTGYTEPISTEGYVKYRAIYEFNGRNADEITFQAGDIVLVPLEQNAEPGWLAGMIDGHTGWFPENYVEKIDNDDDGGGFDNNAPVEKISQAIESTTISSPQQPQKPEPVEQIYNGNSAEYFVACYPYESTEPDDLTFNVGEMILVTKKDGDWWVGAIGSRSGIFPANYVQKAEESNEHIYSEPPLEDYQTEEAKRQEEADSEVSQINTQPKVDPNQEQQQSYSRPMSTTSLRSKKGEVAQVIAPYEATSAEQLSLQKGQLIMIRKKTDTGWWEGELQQKGRRRQIGWFPATYVKILQGGRTSGRTTPVSGGKIEMSETILDKVIALYPYKAHNDDELSFEKDDIISVLGRDEPEWWRGELNGIVGLFPSNYVGPFVKSGKKK